jgi:hypothetical protein
VVYFQSLWPKYKFSLQPDLEHMGEKREGRLGVLTGKHIFKNAV